MVAVVHMQYTQAHDPLAATGSRRCEYSQGHIKPNRTILFITLTITKSKVLKTYSLPAEQYVYYSRARDLHRSR